MGYLLLWLAAISAATASILAAFRIKRTHENLKIHVFIVVLWTIGPPAWFLADSAVRVNRPNQSEGNGKLTPQEEFFYDSAAKFWAGVLALLLAAYSRERWVVSPEDSQAEPKELVVARVALAAAESASRQSQAEVLALRNQVARLEMELVAEKERFDRCTEDLTAERDRIRRKLMRDKARIAVSHGALREARGQVKREQERTKDLFNRVVAETSRAEVLAARLAELDEPSSPSN